MRSLERQTSAAPYSARNSLKPIHFYCHAPDAKLVEIEGDFNQWTPAAMRQRHDGWWYLQVDLSHGHRQYRFLVDGKPTLDPQSTGVGRDEANEAVSIMAVS
jgi:1,4-alpha-glucan branching enzyme